MMCKTHTNTKIQNYVCHTRVDAMAGKRKNNVKTKKKKKERVLPLFSPFHQTNPMTE